MTLFPLFFFIVLFVIAQNDGHQVSSSPLHSNCTVHYNTVLLSEGEHVAMGRKLYKVEDCQLQRAYQVCGTHLWFMLHIVCEALKLYKEQSKMNNHVPRFTREDLLTEACCDNSCTITEMSRYCP